ncbi:MAG: tetratricopeptide repeat protein, partial [Bacteroidales bacterium]
MKKLSYILQIMLFGVFFNILHAQKTFIFKEPISEYQKGLELFSKEKFNAAEVCFLNTIDAINDKQSDMRINSEYYVAVCAIEMYNSDAEYLIKKFISNHPENNKIKPATFQLAKLLYRQQKWGEAIKRFESIDKYDLSSSELSEYYFKTGYGYFMLKAFDKSKKQFFELIDVDTKYFAPSNYYYAQIAYDEKNYETALKCFQKIEKDKYFGPIVPYYIAQIYYLQGKYSDVIQYAPALLDSAKTIRVDEISRILGESYFKTGNYSSSIQFLEKYRAKTKNSISRQDNYELGYAYYKCGLDYESAVDYLGKVTSTSDSLSQNTYYLLGDCYLKTGNKKFAMTSFLTASKLSFYPDIKEDALFNYAKLAYDLALNPYNEAIKAFEKYINDYPTSSKIDEAHTCLVSLYFTTKNYKDALASIEKIKNRNDELNRAYQKIAYYRGIELFNNKNIDGAIELFNKSNSQPLDKSIKAQCIYWKGEAYYRLSQFDSARTCYNTFMLLPGAYS